MEVETVTTGGGGLLSALRNSLARADEALLCVAYVSDAGVHLLRPALERLGPAARLVTTTTFGTTTPTALNALSAFGVDVRILNPSSGNYHPKLYLARTRDTASAVIGSANLTGGLVTNREVAVSLCGTPSAPPLTQAWGWAESVWRDPRVRPWQPDESARRPAFHPTLLAVLRREASRNPVFHTLGRTPKPNHVCEVTPDGLYVETEASMAKGNPPQLIPAWMFELAWDYLRSRGTLSNAYLVANDGLNVKRSSAVCAILARLPGVTVGEGRAIELSWRG